MDYYRLKDKFAIVGVGYTPQGKVGGRTALSFHLEACANAIADAGLNKDDIDGLFLYRHLEPLGSDLDVSGFLVAQHLGLHPAVLSQETYCYRSWLTHAIGLLETGVCRYVLISYGDNGRTRKRAFVSEVRGDEPTDESAAFGDLSLMAKYAMLARRAIEEDGTGPHVWKQIASCQRQWACLNPRAAMYGKPMTPSNYLATEYMVDPFRMLDATMITDGGRAIILTTAERARDLRQPPVLISGFGVSHQATLPLYQQHGDRTAGAAVASQRAFEMAGVTRDDIDACQIYDCFTYTVEATMRDYGFFEPKESAAFFVPDRIGPGGSLPINTSGGLLSEAYCMGLTPVSEAVMQLSGRCGERQLGVLPGSKTPRLMLCSDNGETFQSHLCLILKGGC